MRLQDDVVAMLSVHHPPTQPGTVLAGIARSSGHETKVGTSTAVELVSNFESTGKCELLKVACKGAWNTAVLWNMQQQHVVYRGG